MIEAAMAFSMIVVITSLTPRVVFSRPAMPDQSAPTSIAMTMSRMIWIAPGRAMAPPTAAAANAARRYWPSTPMLKRFIRKPMATASADR